MRFFTIHVFFKKSLAKWVSETSRMTVFKVYLNICVIFMNISDHSKEVNISILILENEWFFN